MGGRRVNKPSYLPDIAFKGFIVLLACAAISKAAESASSQPGFVELRLLTPLSSAKSRVGSVFEAVVISPFGTGGQVVIPVGAIVRGTVLKRTAVGFGIIHERAGISLHFNSYALPDGRAFPIQAKLVAIENARESVKLNGDISGILAADSPQGVLGGVWARPSMASFPRSFLGLTGVAGGITSHFALGPIGAVSLLAARCLIFRMPDPEVQLPTGTEFDVEIASVPKDAPRFDKLEQTDFPVDLKESLESLDYTLQKPNGRPARDIINLVFMGSRETLVTAFRRAGWSEAQPLSRRSKYRMLNAYIAQEGYSAAPASELVYRGEKPDLIAEKSFNNILKRDHVRIWQSTFQGQEIWLGAATRDNGIGFNPHALEFTHSIETDIDLERQKIASDLVFAGCSNTPAFLSRSLVQRDPKTDIITDGRLAVLQLHTCSSSTNTAEVDKTVPTGNIATRFVRRLILEGRQYAERESLVYWAYRVGRWSYRGWRKS